MDSVTPTTTDLSQSLMTNTGFASQAQDGLDSLASQLFANLLSQNNLPQTPSVNTPASFTASVKAQNVPNATPSLPALKKLVNIVHAVIQKLQAHQKNTAGSQSGAKTATTASDTNTSTTAGQTTPTALNNANTNTSQSNGDCDTESAADATTATDPTQQPSLGDLLKQLQAMLQTMEKKLQTAMQVTGDATAVSGADASGQATASPLMQTLNGLLALTQAIGQQFAAAANPDASTQTQSGSAAQTAAPSDAQMKAQLQALLNSLRDNLNVGSSIDATAQASTSDFSASRLAVAAPQTIATIGMTKTDTSKGDLADLFASLQPSDDTTFVPMSAAVPVVAAGDKGSASLNMNMDLDAQGQNAAAQTAAAIAGADTAIAADAPKASSPYSFVSQLTAVRTALGATGLPSAVEQVILQLNRNVKAGSDQMTLQLNPADLGKVDIKLSIDNNTGKVQGTVVADNPATLHLLSKDVGSLERALQEAGLRADPGSLQFSLGGQSGQSKQTSDNASGGQGRGASTSTSAAVAADAATANTNETWYITPGRVNFKV